MRSRPPGPVGAILRHAVLMTGALLMITPFAWMVLTSFKPQAEILVAELHFLPTRWAVVENYGMAMTRVPMMRFLINGVIVTAAIFVLQVLVNLPCAYALAKLRFRGRGVLFAVVLLCLLIPHHATAIPIYILFHKMGLLDSYSALVLPFAVSVFGIFLMRQFFMTVPNDLIDAARIDGLGEFGIVWRIMLPTAVPALIAFGIFSVVAHWNDYFWPLIVVGSEELYTPPLGVAFFRLNDQGTEYGPLMAAATIVILPLVAAFLFAQRRFIEGITFTGMKT
ncbi:carbohydrate ABC transporter membrane protein 2 (CUT1 family) [Stella humosa]|uniref:Carbohydrate ABC transporter membrane protein 2 (CUT1 family) n=1 Tax=Stella humosa TaxID=94 RepID=A0A3N1MCM6_9PROT|nr:carbohydrate ABC transporter permease [Stella humosa]ROQ01471.1 carbohydrate ABC transporter membrane protein 2 (CUT1 family) [Stella humosa]BBK31849.1 sn-glycerol-3-phosphate transport system permease protein UgpE [Stella humosa]